MQKKQLRHLIREQLNLLPYSQYLELSKDIHSLLYKTPEWKETKMIGITLSKFPEVDTYDIIRRSWEENKIVTVPKCLPNTKELNFYQIDSFEQVEKGFYQLVEPIPDKATLIEKDQIELLFVPGLAFSLDGRRLGQGGGYYDRFLSDYYGKTIALAFEKQILSNVPVENHDQKVHKIITEKGVF